MQHLTIDSDSHNFLFNISISMAVAILFFSEIIPKNLGVLYRSKLQPILIFPLGWICTIMSPISKTVGIVVKLFIKPEASNETDTEEEIMLLAEKSAKEGNLTSNEHELINNALSLDEILVNQIMTPRTVVHSINADDTIGSLFQSIGGNIPFARIPVYQDERDNITGIVRRRELLGAKAEDKDELRIAELASPPIFVPDNATADNALQTFLKKHQQLAIAVDEFGTMSGVITMEDVIEHIIGQEIFEDDDPAVDMRELARQRQFAVRRRNRRDTTKD